MPDFEDRSAEAKARLVEATRAGLLAAAYVVYNEVKSRLRGGYTSGAFVTGNVLNSVTIAPPILEGNAMVVRIGTNVDYALFWEVGHFNLFTRRFERVEIWVPAFLDTIEQQRQAFLVAFARVWGADEGGGLTLGSDVELGLT